MEDEILPTARELGVGITAYGVLSRGLLSGAGAGRRGHRATVGQVATASVASRGNAVVPLIGARHREQLAESLGAADLVLSDEDLATIEEAIPAGDRYPPGRGPRSTASDRAVPGTSSIEHLREHLAAARLQIPSEMIADLDSIGEVLSGEGA